MLVPQSLQRDVERRRCTHFLVKSVYRELRMTSGPPKIRTDSSAARKRVGSVKHLEIWMLWLQERPQHDEQVIEKVNTL